MSITFEYVKPTDDQLKVMNEYRAKFHTMYSDLALLPSNRGLSLALTKLEESAMWVNKSITENC